MKIEIVRGRKFLEGDLSLPFTSVSQYHFTEEVRGFIYYSVFLVVSLKD